MKQNRTESKSQVATPDKNHSKNKDGNAEEKARGAFPRHNEKIGGG